MHIMTSTKRICVTFGLLTALSGTIINCIAGDFNIVVYNKTPQSFDFTHEVAMNGAPWTPGKQAITLMAGTNYTKSLSESAFQSMVKTQNPQIFEEGITINPKSGATPPSCTSALLSASKILTQLNTGDVNLVFTVTNSFNCTATVSPSSVIN